MQQSCLPVTMPNPQHYSGRRTLDHVKTMQQAVRYPIQDCVPVVNTPRHEGMDEGFAGCSVQAFAYPGNKKHVKIGASAGVRHLSRHIESIVKNSTDVANGRQQRYNSPANVNSALNRSYTDSG